MNIEIRTACESDAAQIAEIYRPYVESTAVSFEYIAPDAEGMKKRISAVLESYPFLVALRGGEIVGYTYASRLKERRAFDLTAEVSIYVRKDQKRGGIGKKLYAALEEILLLQNVKSVNVSIAYSNDEDEYLTHDSLAFHTRMGYRQIGIFHKCGYKFGKWYDLLWAEKHIGDFEDNPAPFVPFPMLEKNKLKEINMKPTVKGIHHIALKAQGLENFEQLVSFYHEILGLPIVRRWGEGENVGMMLDTGAGLLEIFANAPDRLGTGALRHIAFDVEDTDACIEAVRAAGYKVTMEPTDIVIASEPPYPARIAFCIGPVGEEVEFFKVK